MKPFLLTPAARRPGRRYPTLTAAAVVALGLGIASPRPAGAIEIQCGFAGDGDAFGLAVAGGGDWDGDGAADIAVGAPCAWVGASSVVGRVRVYSGATGERLASLAGSGSDQGFGSALAFVPDLNGDGKAELAIGSLRFDAPRDNGGVRVNAGRLEVRSAKPGASLVWAVNGATANANLGETVAALPDLNGDGKGELVVGAGGAQVDGDSKGSAFVLSGANGSVLAQSDGDVKDGDWSSLVGSAGDVDGDGKGDFLVASNSLDILPPAPEALDATTTTTQATTTSTTTTTTIVDRAGRLAVVSGASPFGVITEFWGEEDQQRLGRAAASTSDATSDGKGDLWIGSPGASVGNQLEAGAIDLHSGLGPFVRRVTEPTPQTLAAFGTSVVAPGSLDGGAGRDVVAGAPLARVSGAAEAGRVHAFNGSNGALLWTRNGDQAGARFGYALDAGIDYDGDGVKDVVVGAPGAAPGGRRGAGAVSVVSGDTGAVLASFPGRRGRETRLFVAGPGTDRRAVVRSFDPTGKRREAEVRPFRGQAATALSMALLDGGTRASAPRMLLAVGSGKAGTSSSVAVFRATRRRQRVSLFAAGPVGYSGGLSVAGGNFSSGFEGFEIAAAPADATTGNIDVVIHGREFTDPFGRITWGKVRQFTAFTPTDKVGDVAIGAVGVSIVGGPLSDAAELHEVVVAPRAGLPVVKVLSNTGSNLAQKQVYPVQTPNLGTNSGVSIAVGDLRGNGSRQILTAPAKGQLWVRAWNGDLTEFRQGTGGEGPAVSFFVTQFGPVFEGGLTLAAADVDLDGADEIVVAPGAGIAARLLAFEIDGTPVAGWATYQPFGPLAEGGLSLLGTNAFWRP